MSKVSCIPLYKCLSACPFTCPLYMSRVHAPSVPLPLSQPWVTNSFRARGSLCGACVKQACVNFAARQQNEEERLCIEGCRGDENLLGFIQYMHGSIYLQLSFILCMWWRLLSSLHGCIQVFIRDWCLVQLVALRQPQRQAAIQHCYPTNTHPDVDQWLMP